MTVKKYSLCLLICIFLSIAVEAHNRIATLSDRELYGDYITPGDLIIDTPTRDTRERRDVIYYFMARQWPGLKDGATIWLDGDRLGTLTEIKFCNTSKATMPWHIASARIRNIPNTRVIAKGIVVQGLKHFELDGQSSFFPGLSSWPSARKFLTGAFGFHVIGNLVGGHCYTINVLDGGTIRLNGFEAQHGFSGLRINGGKDDITVQSIEITNFYIHDTATGEGQYLGATQKPPFAKLKNLKIYNGIITRTAAEGLQLQHLAGGTDVHHVTIFAADVRWMNEFGAGQDTGIQWVVDAGENKLHHVIVDGYGSIGLMPFGSDLNRSRGISRVSRVLFNDGRDTGLYLHKSASFGVDWFFDSIYFRGLRATYYQETGRNVRKFYVSRKHGNDNITFNNIFHDGSKEMVFQDTAAIDYGAIAEKKLPEPTYINNGFHEPASRIKQWHPFYAPYFPVSRRDSIRVQAPTQWNAGDIAIETVGEYAFFKCIKTHAADSRRPGSHPYFVRLTWDENGVRSDQPAWQASSVQSAFPPDDLRLEKDNYWKKLGFGFQEERLNGWAKNP